MQFILISLIPINIAGAGITAEQAANWKTVVDIDLEFGGANVKTYTSREEFNQLAASATYIRYKTNKIGTAVYKRRTAWGSIDQYELFVNKWSVKGENEFHKDFDIFSTYEDALADQNAWQYCNGDDNGVGFPRDCAAERKTNWRWFAFPRGAEYSSTAVDFIKRFDNRYISGRCYTSASFEIYVESKEPALLGCFKDERARDLPGRMKSFANGNREQCFAACQAAGYKYAGLQWKGECHCGNEYGKYGSADQCNCERGSNNFGTWQQCIYDMSGAEPAPAEVVEESEESDAVFVGCFKDEKQRDLPARKQNFKAGNREQCFQQCSEAGYQYAGLQWNGECHCGNAYGQYGEGDKCNCERGSKEFGYWQQCIYDLAANKALLI